MFNEVERVVNNAWYFLILKNHASLYASSLQWMHVWALTFWMVMLGGKVVILFMTYL